MRSGAKTLALGMAFAAVLAAAPARADNGKQMPAHKITQAKSYIGLNPMYATILDNGRPVGLLLVSIGLNIPDATLRDAVQRALPVLRDCYVRNLMAFTAAAVRPWRQPNVNVIARRMQGVTNRLLHAKGAKVLLGQVMIRISK
jgi:hypothetical protein